MVRFEMDRLADLRPAASVPRVRLVAVDDPATQALELRALHDLIGTPHRWSSLGWGEHRWRVWVGDPGRRHWIVEHDGERVGWACCRRHGARETEIESFGLVPSAIGLGLGGHTLTLLAREAWSVIGGAGLVWLTTTSWDHPHAAPNYRARGFVERRPHPA